MSKEQPIPALTPERQGYVLRLGRLPEEEARKIARQRGATHVLDDLESAAKMAATRAAATYTAVEGATFADLAKHHIRGAVYDYLRHEGRQRTYRRAAEMAARHGYSQMPPSPEDAVDSRHDDDDVCREKLNGYASAKLGAITVAFWLETERSELDPETAAAMRPFIDAMRATIASFRPSDQRLLRCVYEAGMSLRDAAADVEIAYPTAKVRHRKLLDRLRESFKQSGVTSS